VSNLASEAQEITEKKKTENEPFQQRGSWGMKTATRHLTRVGEAPQSVLKKANLKLPRGRGQMRAKEDLFPDPYLTVDTRLLEKLGDRDASAKYVGRLTKLKSPRKTG